MSSYCDLIGYFTVGVFEWLHQFSGRKTENDNQSWRWYQVFMELQNCSIYIVISFYRYNHLCDEVTHMVVGVVKGNSDIVLLQHSHLRCT